MTHKKKIGTVLPGEAMAIWLVIDAYVPVGESVLKNDNMQKHDAL